MIREPIDRTGAPMSVLLSYDPALTSYRFPAGHPMRPERFSRAVELMRAWNLLAEEPTQDDPMATVAAPVPADETDLLLAHDADLIAAVKEAGANPFDADPRFGLGEGDTPGFPGMHEAAAMAVGATLTATRAVLDGQAARAFAPSGGLHHAHRRRSAGFCIYNDCVVAIERATRIHPGLRVAYVDIDAHHGDGVQEAFVTRADVLTLSVHESGAYLYPGTGSPREIGEGEGRGFTLNVALPPSSEDLCYRTVQERVIGPALRSFAPDLVFLQAGADAYTGDPLTHLALSVAGYSGLVSGIIDLARETAGRIVVVGGGGYEPYSAVPRMWACVMAHLLGSEIPPTIPADWLAVAREHVPGAGSDTFADDAPDPDPASVAEARRLTQRLCDSLIESHPLLAATACAPGSATG